MSDDRFDYSDEGIPLFPPSVWGHDHATLLLYVETVHIDHNAQMDPTHLRTNEQRHPHEKQDSVIIWRNTHATRLADGMRPCDEHDDWDCLDDFSDEGLLIFTGAPSFMVALSEVGVIVASELRKYKGRANPLVEFDWEKAVLEATRVVEGDDSKGGAEDGDVESEEG